MNLGRILVVGGAGFIGSRLVKRLIDMDLEVRVLDDLSSGSWNGLTGVKDVVDFIYGDIRNRDVVRKATSGIDAVIHLAGKISAKESIDKPMEYHEVNVTGTLNVLDACVTAGVGKFVFSSSASVYGEPSELPIKENSPLRPLTPYGASKLAAEHYINAYHRVYGLNTVILRVFNVYGCRRYFKDHSDVVSRFLERIGEDKPPIIYGDGFQTRDFIYIDDVVDAFVLALKENCPGETFNIGSGKPVSINELADMMLRLSGKEWLKPIHVEPMRGDVRHSYADISKAMERLKFRPKTPLEDGLTKLLKTFQLIKHSSPSLRRLLTDGEG